MFAAAFTSVSNTLWTHLLNFLPYSSCWERLHEFILSDLCCSALDYILNIKKPKSGFDVRQSLQYWSCPRAPSSYNPEALPISVFILQLARFLLPRALGYLLKFNESILACLNSSLELNTSFFLLFLLLQKPHELKFLP